MFPVSDPIIYFGILVVGILLAPVLSGRFRIPDLIILLIFGAVIGPNALHVLGSSNAVTMLGSVGMIYIMFLAGLEINFYRFQKSYKRSIVLGLLTFLIPQILGTFAGRYLLQMSWLSSILLASMFASHTLLAYPQASRLGIAQREPVAITVGATIITDTLALLVLAVIADMAKGMSLDLKLIAIIMLGMAILTVLIWKVVPLLSRWFFGSISEESNTQYLFVMVILCLFAYLSHLAKMEPIIGAFLVGAAFNRLIPAQGRLMNRINFTGNTLFIPIFLISVGMLVDIKAMLSDYRSWLVGGVMIAAVIITKYMAAQIVRFVYKYSSASGNVIFGLSVVQAAATLAAVMVGYKLKILPEEVLNGTILMILVTCLLGSWIVERSGRKMALEEKNVLIASSARQSLLVMVSSIANALPVLDLAFLLQESGKDNSLHSYTIINNQTNIEEAIAEGENLLGHCVAHSAAADITVEPGLRVENNVADGINHIALELNATAVISGYSEKSRHFGSIMHELTENCRARLIFCSLQEPLNTIRRIIIPLPAFACHRRDIADFVKTAKLISSQTGSGIHVFLDQKESCDLQELFENTEPDTSVKFSSFSKWQNLLQELFAEIKTSDMILLPLDRRSGIMWKPSLENLPQMLKNKFPQNNLLIDYPSSEKREFVAFNKELIISSGEPILIPVETDNKADLNEVIKLLANEVIPESTQCMDETCRQLNELLASFPVELTPGIVLIHTQNSAVKDTLIAVCHIPGTIRIDNVNPVRFLIALLSPRYQEPEIHLKNLSFIATGIRKIEKENDLDNLTSAKELCSLLEAL
ncbi:MAG: cation:proton antiporter [Candidatus Cloacimonetes bacterium]|nr:cation:proton antiporter [Candidatus Cloacimonadota bacterium]